MSSTVRESILKSIRGGEDLAGQNFSGVNLSEANLDGAKLTATDWTKANLREASLRFAILTDADLSGADLSNANLFGADMRFVNFQGTVLTGADLAGADLLGAKNLPRDVGSYESTPETSRGISGGKKNGLRLMVSAGVRDVRGTWRKRQISARNVGCLSRNLRRFGAWASPIYYSHECKAFVRLCVLEGGGQVVSLERGAPILELVSTAPPGRVMGLDGCVRGSSHD